MRPARAVGLAAVVVLAACSGSGSGPVDGGASATSPGSVSQPSTSPAPTPPGTTAPLGDAAAPLAAGQVRLRLEGLDLAPGGDLVLSLDVAEGDVAVAATAALEACGPGGGCRSLGRDPALVAASGSSRIRLRAPPPAGARGVTVTTTWTPASRAVTLEPTELGPGTLRLTLVPPAGGRFAATADWGDPSTPLELRLTVRPLDDPAAPGTEAGTAAGGPPLRLDHRATPPQAPELAVRATGAPVQDLTLAVTWP